MHQLTPDRFEENAREALANEQLRKALKNATGLFAERRLVAMSSVDDWEWLRERARRIKEETLANLDKYLEEFADNAQKQGARVHWARDAAEACAIVIGIARQRGARHVVKSKSMATEEIHLNDALLKEG